MYLSLTLSISESESDSDRESDDGGVSNKYDLAETLRSRNHNEVVLSDSVWRRDLALRPTTSRGHRGLVSADVGGTLVDAVVGPLSTAVYWTTIVMMVVALVYMVHDIRVAYEDAAIVRQKAEVLRQMPECMDMAQRNPWVDCDGAMVSWRRSHTIHVMDLVIAVWTTRITDAANSVFGSLTLVYCVTKVGYWVISRVLPV